MAVAQSPIINNTASARWYRKAVRAGVMEIHSLLWEHAGRIFSSSSAPSPLLSPRPVTLRLRSSLCHSPFCLGIAFFFPLSEALSGRSAGTSRGWLGWQSFIVRLRLRRQNGSAAPTIVAISVPCGYHISAFMFQHLRVSAVLHYLCVLVFVSHLKIIILLKG